MASGNESTNGSFQARSNSIQSQADSQQHSDNVGAKAWADNDGVKSGTITRPKTIG